MIRLKSGDGKNILDYPGGPNPIARVLPVSRRHQGSSRQLMTEAEEKKEDQNEPSAKEASSL